MPKKIDPAVKERALRMVAEHRGEYASLTACCDQVGRRLGLGKELDRSTVARAVQLFSTAKAPMFVSDWHGTGSTVAFRPSGDTQDTHFGPSSAHHHRAAGYMSCLEDEDRLRKDLDDPSDLEKVAALLPAFHRVDRD